MDGIDPQMSDKMDEFANLFPDPVEFDSQYHSQDLQSRLEDIISGSAQIADLPSTWNGLKY